MKVSKYEIKNFMDDICEEMSFRVEINNTVEWSAGLIDRDIDKIEGIVRLLDLH